MGEDPRNVFFTGCPAIDILANLDFSLTPDMFRRYKGVGPDIDPLKPYLVVLQHPVTTEYGEGLLQVNETLNAVERIRMPTVWLWPNVDAGSDDISKGLRVYREKKNPDFIHFYRNFSAEDYAYLINNSKCLVGNSSSALREGSFLGVPSVNIGTRQQHREHGENVIHVNYDSDEIEGAICRQIKNGKYEKSSLFGEGRASEQIADILAKIDVTIQKRLFF
jgi:UDP-hydrolysing UDP-N-acetyl-D-glucosamine 2-epimerase